MILFLNFAPISYGGGVERWITSVGEAFSKSEETIFLDVDRCISDLYAELVFKRKFLARNTDISKKILQKSIFWRSLLPFTADWKKIRDNIRTARVIYTKLEVNELLILFYYGGFSVLKKTIIGLHSPFIYHQDNLSFFESLHNIVYQSFVIKKILSMAKQIHTLNEEQTITMKSTFGLSNVTLIPNFIETPSEYKPAITVPDHLAICFVGELSLRKGADILLEIISKSPKHFTYQIAGDGPLKPQFAALKSPQVKYLGFLQKTDVEKVLETSDLLLMPSRAESFSLATLEALSHGMSVICSTDISPSILEKYLVMCKKKAPDEFISKLNQVFQEKVSKTLETKRRKIWLEVNKQFSKKEILSLLTEQLFHIAS